MVELVKIDQVNDEKFTEKMMNDWVNCHEKGDEIVFWADKSVMLDFVDSEIYKHCEHKLCRLEGDDEFITEGLFKLILKSNVKRKKGIFNIVLEFVQSDESELKLSENDTTYITLENYMYKIKKLTGVDLDVVFGNSEYTITKTVKGGKKETGILNMDDLRNYRAGYIEVQFEGNAQTVRNYMYKDFPDLSSIMVGNRIFAYKKGEIEDCELPEPIAENMIEKLKSKHDRRINRLNTELSAEIRRINQRVVRQELNDDEVYE